MTTLIIIITGFMLISAILHIRAEYTNNRRQIYIFKPLTVLLIITLAFRPSPETAALYRYFILIGLGCSFCGDIFLMLPSDQFIKGLVSFLLAHIGYIAAFSSDVGLQFHPLLLLPSIIIGVVLFAILLPHTGKMTIPVIVYAVVILIMFWQALERLGVSHSSQSPLLAAIGAGFFVVSDAILAYNRFVRPFKLARLLNLSTYYAAQWFIALSV